jgi:outer membrane protein assembly factor BamB
MPVAAAAALMIALLFSAGLRADDWPQWRGPNRDGVWRESGILQAIPETGLKVLWRAPVGPGWSAPAVAMGRVFVTDHQFRPEVERILCFEQTTGNRLWMHSHPCDYQEMEYGNGPRAAPTIHDGKVYTLGAKGHLSCLDAAKGQVLWEKDLADEFNARIPTYGASAAPLVEGDLLIVIAGGRPDATVIAFDRSSGEVRWKALNDRPAYSSPIAITAGGARQVIVWTADAVSSLHPSTGNVYWRVPYKATFDEAQAVASPVLRKDMLLCLGAWNRGSMMLKLDPAKPAATVFWKTRSKPTTTISTPLFLDDTHVAVMNGDGSLGCVDALTGDELWNSREPTSTGFGNLHLTPNGDRVFLFNHRGHLILAHLTPAGYQELGRALLVEPTAGYRAAGPVAWAHPAYANKCVFARNDRELVCASLAADQGEAAPATPKSTAKARLLNDFTGTNAALALAFSPDGALLALGTWRGTVNVLDLATGKALPAPPGHKDFLAAVAFAPNGRYLVSAGGSEFKPARNGSRTSGEVKLWDVAGRKEFGQPTGHTDKVTSAAFSPDSKTLATASADRTVRLWDVATGTERAVLRGHTDAVWSVAFSPDGNTVISAGWDRTVRLWDSATGKELGSLEGHEEEILCLAASPDGRTLATGSTDWTIRLWDLPTRAQRALLKGHQGAVNGLAFSPDGQTLASGSGDETVKLWAVATARERATLRGHRSGVSAVAFSPDGRTLASAGLDDAVRLWEVH